MTGALDRQAAAPSVRRMLVPLALAQFTVDTASPARMAGATSITVPVSRGGCGR